MHIHILGICGTFMGGIALLARAAGLLESAAGGGNTTTYTYDSLGNRIAYTLDNAGNRRIISRQLQFVEVDAAGATRARAVAAAIPGAEIHVIEGVGHAPHREAPERVLPLMLHAIERNPS